MAGLGSSSLTPAVPHGSGAGATSNNSERSRLVSYCPRNPGGNDQTASFKDDVKDYAQKFDCWATLRTPATTLEEIASLNSDLSEAEQKSLYDTIHGKWQRDSRTV